MESGKSQSTEGRIFNENFFQFNQVQIFNIDCTIINNDRFYRTIEMT